MINNRFLYYKNLNTFTQDLDNGQINRESIVFIEETKLIWTHGVYFGSQAQESIDIDIPVIIIDDSLSSTSTNPVENRVVKNALDNKVDNSTLTNYYTKSQVYNKSEIDDAFGINAETLSVIQQLIEELNSGEDDSTSLEALFNLIAQKADKSQLELKADKSDLRQYYNKEDSDNKYLTQAEFDDYRYPIRHTFTVSPSSVEYTTGNVNVSVYYSIYRQTGSVTPDEVSVSVGNTEVYNGTDSSKTISTTVNNGNRTITLSYKVGGKTVSENKSVSFIKPSYIFYSAASSKDTVQLPQGSKHLWTSITQSNIALPNYQDGVYLWIVTPNDDKYELNKVTTDAGRAYTVDMLTPVIDNNTGLKYHRSASSIDRVDNINYWLS